MPAMKASRFSASMAVPRLHIEERKMLTAGYIPMCFYTVLLKSTIGRVRVSLRKPRKFAADLLMKIPLRDAGEFVKKEDCRNATESVNPVGSNDAQQSDSASVGTERSTEFSGHPVREIEAMLRWAGWTKSQSIIEASRDARTLKRTHP